VSPEIFALAGYLVVFRSTVMSEHGSTGPLPDGRVPKIEPAADETETPALTSRESAILDVRQRELMSKESADGLPPTKTQRVLGWKVLAIVLTALAIGAVTWAIQRDVSLSLILGFGGVFLLLLILGGWPVMTAALFRGQEEAVAKKEAVSEILRRDDPR